MKKRKVKSRMPFLPRKQRAPRATQAAAPSVSNGTWLVKKEKDEFYIECRFGPYTTYKNANEHASALNTMQRDPLGLSKKNDVLGLFS